MVTAKTQYNLKNAREYFEEHLCVGDYYDEGQRVSGEWVGVGAERLGLAGKVRADDFLRLCENQHPGTGEKLTQRQNTTRTEGDKNTANRRIFYDFTFSPPKSVSLVGFLGNKFVGRFNHGAKWITHHAGIFPVGVVNAPQLVARL